MVMSSTSARTWKFRDTICPPLGHRKSRLGDHNGCHIRLSIDCSLIILIRLVISEHPSEAQYTDYIRLHSLIYYRGD